MASSQMNKMAKHSPVSGDGHTGSLKSPGAVEMIDPVRAFDALAHDARLAVFRLLIPAGREGLPAGHIGAHLGLPANSLSFHLSRLTLAGLLTCRRQGRQLFYAVDYPTLSGIVEFLACDCCADAPEECLPGCPTVPPADKRTAAPRLRRLTR